MKFRFLGDFDAPDWLLSEVAVLARMSSVRMTLVCRQVVNSILGHEINYTKIKKLTTSNRLRWGHTLSSTQRACLRFEPSDVKAMVAALDFVFRNAARYSTPTEVLQQELLQLGLPNDVTTSIVREYRANEDRLHEKLQEESFRLPRFDGVSWRVDYLLASGTVGELETPSVRLQIRRKDASPLSFELSHEQFRVLHASLNGAAALMDGIS